jgi:IS30 family transposase
MHGHKLLSERTGIQICFAAPHGPWQHGSNKNTNGCAKVLSHLIFLARLAYDM